jgi:hypothetical protein
MRSGAVREEMTSHTLTASASSSSLDADRAEAEVSSRCSARVMPVEA